MRICLFSSVFCTDMRLSLFTTQAKTGYFTQSSAPLYFQCISTVSYSTVFHCCFWAGHDLHLCQLSTMSPLLTVLNTLLLFCLWKSALQYWRMRHSGEKHSVGEKHTVEKSTQWRKAQCWLENNEAAELAK